MERKNIINERPPKTSKYKVKYGKTLQEIADLFGVSLATVHNWLNDPEKKKWLEEKLEEIN